MKKSFVFDIMVTILFSMGMFNVFTSAANGNIFSDVPSTHQNAQAIQYLKDQHIINGYPDGSFKPDQAVNRVEALKFILLGAGIGTANSTKIASFSDTKQGEWYNPYLNKAVELGIVKGYPDGSFKPTVTVNLVENLKMLLLAEKIDLSKITVTQAPYADIPLGQWYTNSLQYAKENHLIDADSQNKVYPSQGMTRAKLAETMYRMMNLSKTTSTAISETPTSSTQQPQTSTNLYDLTGLILDLSIQSSSYSKDSITIGTGTTLRWTNKDTVPHTVTSDSGIFDSGSIAPGGTFSYSFKQVGTYAYHCTFHPGMKATVIIKPAIEVPSI